jgi:hypothetical protein
LFADLPLLLLILAPSFAAFFYLLLAYRQGRSFHCHDYAAFKLNHAYRGFAPLTEKAEPKFRLEGRRAGGQFD